MVVYEQKFFISNFCVLQTKKLTPPFLSHKGKVCGRPPQNKTKQEEEDAKKKEYYHIIYQ